MSHQVKRLLRFELEVIYNIEALEKGNQIIISRRF